MPWILSLIKGLKPQFFCFMHCLLKLCCIEVWSMIFLPNNFSLISQKAYSSSHALQILKALIVSVSKLTSHFVLFALGWKLGDTGWSSGITLIHPGFFWALQLLLKIKIKTKQKQKRPKVDSISCSDFLFFGDSIEKSLRLKSFHPTYGHLLLI